MLNDVNNDVAAAAAAADDDDDVTAPTVKEAGKPLIVFKR